MEKEKNEPEVSESASNQDDSSVTSTDSNQEAQTPKDIDPRIVNIIGEDKIQSAYSEKESNGSNDSDSSTNSDTFESDSNEEKDVDLEKDQKTNQDDSINKDGVAVENQKQQLNQNSPKPTRLDRRLAGRYVRNLHLLGEQNIPSEEDILADLRNYSKEDKIEALHFHLRKEKELRGLNSSDNKLDEEDIEAIQDTEREAIRQEIIEEEQEKQIMKNFITFFDAHPELDSGSKEYNPQLAQAVETLWNNGMHIDIAYQTVTEQLDAVKKNQIAQEQKRKSAALSGVLSGTGQQVSGDKELSWEDAQRISQEDPQKYRQMLLNGQFKHLN